MNKQTDKNLIRLLAAALIISLGSVAFLSSRYLDLVDKQTNYLLTSQPLVSNIQRSSNLSSVATSEIPELVYRNGDYGYEIQFPQSWQGYSFVKSDPSDPTAVGFVFKEFHQPFAIFQIKHYTKKQWDSLKKNTMKKLFERPDGSIIACDGCCYSNGDTTGGGQFDEFQVERCKEAPLILENLKQTN